MTKQIKAALAGALLTATTSVFAAVGTEATPVIMGVNDTEGDTGVLIVQGDDQVGLANGANVSYAERDTEFTTSFEVFVVMNESSRAFATQAAHVDGKGTVFYSDTNGNAGICEEYITLAKTLALDTVNFTVTFSALDAITTRLDESITGCTPV